jgi:rRNA maturation endonuclease Nob1
MIFFYNLQRDEFFGLLLLLAVVAGICWHFAVKSRKTYTCPECGERVKVEYMEASRCPMCGSQLNKDQKDTP